MAKSRITAAHLRQLMLDRIDAHQKRTGMNDAKLGSEAVSDHKFVGRIRAGGNFTVKTFERVMDWLDSAERERAA